MHFVEVSQSVNSISVYASVYVILFQFLFFVSIFHSHYGKTIWRVQYKLYKAKCYDNLFYVL